jgi:hypothetical protein
VRSGRFLTLLSHPLSPSQISPFILFARRLAWSPAVDSRDKSHNLLGLPGPAWPLIFVHLGLCLDFGGEPGRKVLDRSRDRRWEVLDFGRDSYLHVKLESGGSLVLDRSLPRDATLRGEAVVLRRMLSNLCFTSDQKRTTVRGVSWERSPTEGGGLRRI